MRIIEAKLSRGEKLYPDEEALLAKQKEKRKQEKPHQTTREERKKVQSESPYLRLLNAMKERIHDNDPLLPEDEAFIDECEVELLRLLEWPSTSEYGATPSEWTIKRAFSPMLDDMFTPQGVSRYEYVKNIVSPIDREKVNLRPKTKALVQSMNSQDLLVKLASSPEDTLVAAPGFYRALILEIEDRGLVPANLNSLLAIKRHPLDKTLHHFTQEESKIEVDGDTVRVQLHGKGRYITFELRNITTEFLKSDRTNEDAIKSGMYLYCTIPTELGIQLQTEAKEFAEKSVTPQTDGPVERYVADEHIASAYGVTLEEYDEAAKLAWEFGLKALQCSPY